MSYRLKTIVEADTATPSTVFTPTVINVGDIAVSDFNSNENTSNCCSTLFINRSGVLPTPPPSPPPTLTPTPSITPTITPTITPPVVFPQNRGARIMITVDNSQTESNNVLGQGSFICLMDSDDCDNWVCRNPTRELDNRSRTKDGVVGLFYNYNPTPCRTCTDETLYQMIGWWWSACIPTNLPGNPFKTLLVSFSFVLNTSTWVKTNYLNIGTSVDNTISQAPAGSSAVTWTRYINPVICYQSGDETSIEPRAACPSGSAPFILTDCFWDPNNSAGPRMYVIFNRSNNGGTAANTRCGHIVDPLNPSYTPGSSTAIIPENTDPIGGAGAWPASERFCRLSPNGYVYCAAFLYYSKTLRIVYYDRKKRNIFPSGWNSLPNVTNIPGVDQDTVGSQYYIKAKIIRVGFFNNGDAVLCYIIPRNKFSSPAPDPYSYSNPYSDLYMQFYRANTNSWTTPTIVKGNLITRGIAVLASVGNNLNAYYQDGTFAPYDLIVNPLNQEIHLIFNQDTGSQASNQRIYFARFNINGQQIGNDLEVFNPATNSGVAYGFAGDIELFYKSTNSTEFIPYFKTETNAINSLTQMTGRYVLANTHVFKFNGSTYTKIFTPSVPSGFKPFYKSSGGPTASYDFGARNAVHRVFQ